MKSYAIAFALALAASALLTPLVRALSVRLGLIDQPDGRKVHARTVPRTGGVGILLAFLAPMVGIALTNANVGQTAYENVDYVAGILVGGMFMAMTGLMDDLRGLGAKKKLLLQGLVATFAFVVGFRIDYLGLPFGEAVDMGVFSYVVTVVWIVGVINAVNLIDGLDGLAGGIAFLVLALNFVLGTINGSVLVCLVSAALAGAVLGFLFYNFNPASIFMGDAGSMFIGYVLALSAINSGQKSATTVALLTPIVAMGIPIMDTLFSVIRRFIENRSLFAADRGHIHHRLLDMGVTHRRAVLILYGFTVTLVVLALLLYIGRKWEVGLGLALMVVAFAVFARIVGVFEYFNRRKLSRAGLLSGHAERLRRSIAPLLMQADAVQAWDQVQPLLEDLCRRVEFVSAGVEFDTPDLPTVRCGKDAPQRDGRKRLLVAALPLQKSGAEFGRLVCSWYSERGRVTPETEILLQVLADRLAERLPRA